MSRHALLRSAIEGQGLLAKLKEKSECSDELIRLVLQIENLILQKALPRGKISYSIGSEFYTSRTPLSEERQQQVFENSSWFIAEKNPNLIWKIFSVNPETTTLHIDGFYISDSLNEICYACSKSGKVFTVFSGDNWINFPFFRKSEQHSSDSLESILWQKILVLIESETGIPIPIHIKEFTRTTDDSLWNYLHERTEVDRYLVDLCTQANDQWLVFDPDKQKIKRASIIKNKRLDVHPGSVIIHSSDSFVLFAFPHLKAIEILGGKSTTMKPCLFTARNNKIIRDLFNSLLSG